MKKREACLALTAAAMVVAVTGGPLRSAFAEEANWLPITLLYQTDVKGKVEPCG